MSDFIEKLHSNQLFSLQPRNYNKLLMFAYSIKTKRRAPIQLRSQIDLAVPEDGFKQIKQIKSKKYTVSEEERLFP